MVLPAPGTPLPGPENESSFSTSTISNREIAPLPNIDPAPTGTMVPHRLENTYPGRPEHMKPPAGLRAQEASQTGIQEQEDLAKALSNSIMPAMDLNIGEVEGSSPEGSKSGFPLSGGYEDLKEGFEPQILGTPYESPTDESGNPIETDGEEIDITQMLGLANALSQIEDAEAFDRSHSSGMMPGGIDMGMAGGGVVEIEIIDIGSPKNDSDLMELDHGGLHPADGSGTGVPDAIITMNETEYPFWTTTQPGTPTTTLATSTVVETVTATASSTPIAPIANSAVNRGQLAGFVALAAITPITIMAFLACCIAICLKKRKKAKADGYKEVAGGSPSVSVIGSRDEEWR